MYISRKINMDKMYNFLTAYNFTENNVAKIEGESC